jgi:hypothetical protein
MREEALLEERKSDLQALLQTECCLVLRRVVCSQREPKGVRACVCLSLFEIQREDGDVGLGVAVRF